MEFSICMCKHVFRYIFTHTRLYEMKPESVVDCIVILVRLLYKINKQSNEESYLSVESRSIRWSIKLFKKM